jgi:hypothetical protein
VASNAKKFIANATKKIPNEKFIANATATIFLFGHFVQP